MMKTRIPITDERGIAFPMAMIVLTVLMALMAAFAFLATSEPQIAANHMASVQARSLAESGLERALWALTQGEASPAPAGTLVNSGPPNYTIAIAPPYDGSTFVSVSSVGGFKVTVSELAPPVINQKVVTAVGFVPNDTNPVAVKKITAKVTRIKWMDPYCGLCAGAETPPGGATEIDVGGNATVNGSGSSHNVGGRTVAGGRYCKKNDNSNLMPMAAVASTGIVKTNGSPNVFTPDGGSTAIQQNADATSPSWQVMTLSDSDMVTLKAMAKARGTYYQPTSPGGKVTFTSPPPNGIVFVDTYSGNPLTPSSPSSDLSVPLVDIHGWGNAAPFKGWLIAAGTIDVSGNIAVDGLIYSQNDITLHGTGNGTIAGAVISTNRVDTTKSNVDATDIGNNPIVYDCLNVRSGGGQLSQNWFVAPGSYQEIPGR